MQNQVFVLDTNQQPLTPCHPATARKLLRDEQAAVYRRYPFTIILKHAVGSASYPTIVEPVMLKVDPGSKTTGIALVQNEEVIFAAEFGYPNVQALAKKSLKNAGVVNSVRWATWRMFDHTGLPVEVGTGGRTKFNRTTQTYPKVHWIDAACVGQSGQTVKLCPEQKPLTIRAVGRQSRQMCRKDKYGFQRTSAKQSRVVKGGFQTGDIVRAVVPTGKNVGTHIGVVAVRATGNFRVGRIDGISWKYCKKLHAQDGYVYGD